MTPAQAEFVAERLYRAVLGRSPDAEGLRNASSEILFGNLEKLTNSLVFSSEARDARLSPEQKLERIYQGLLNRPPGAGAQGYLDRVRQGRTTDVVLTVLDSEEFLRQLPQ
jgi:hypothetical protein